MKTIIMIIGGGIWFCSIAMAADFSYSNISLTPATLDAKSAANIDINNKNYLEMKGNITNASGSDWNRVNFKVKLFDSSGNLIGINSNEYQPNSVPGTIMGGITIVPSAINQTTPFDILIFCPHCQVAGYSIEYSGGYCQDREPINSQGHCIANCNGY